MNDIIRRLDKLLNELADEQAIPDDFWRAEWASIKESLLDREFERRKRVPKTYELPTH